MVRLNSSFPYQKQLKNRSSKQNKWFTGPGHKNILRCVSNAQLQEWANREVVGAAKELARRQARRDRKGL